MKQIDRVTVATLAQAGAIHSLSWIDSHRAFCTEEFLALHTPERQSAHLLELMNSGGSVFMLSVDGRPVGVVSVQGNLIENLYILPGEQRRGYGTELLRFAMEQCDAPPTLWLLCNNDGARRLYERMGFCLTGKRNDLTESLWEVELQFVPENRLT